MIVVSKHRLVAMRLLVNSSRSFEIRENSERYTYAHSYLEQSRKARHIKYKSVTGSTAQSVKKCNSK